MVSSELSSKQLTVIKDVLIEDASTSDSIISWFIILPIRSWKLKRGLYNFPSAFLESYLQGEDNLFQFYCCVQVRRLDILTANKHGQTVLPSRLGGLMKTMQITWLAALLKTHSTSCALLHSAHTYDCLQVFLRLNCSRHHNHHGRSKCIALAKKPHQTKPQRSRPNFLYGTPCHFLNIKK